MREGDYKALNEKDPNVLSYLRSYKGKAVLVAINMSASTQKVSFDLRGHDIKGSKAKTIISGGGPTGEVNLNGIALAPFGVYIGEVK